MHTVFNENRMKISIVCSRITFRHGNRQALNTVVRAVSLFQLVQTFFPLSSYKVHWDFEHLGYSGIAQQEEIPADLKMTQPDDTFYSSRNLVYLVSMSWFLRIFVAFSCVRRFQHTALTNSDPPDFLIYHRLWLSYGDGQMHTSVRHNAEPRLIRCQHIAVNVISYECSAGNRLPDAESQCRYSLVAVAGDSNRHEEGAKFVHRD